VENVKVEELEINNAIRLVVSFSAIGDRIYLRTYEVTITGSNILEQEGDITIGEVAPKVDMVLRRSKFADQELWKEAVKQPKPITKRDVQSSTNLAKKHLSRRGGRQARARLHRQPKLVGAAAEEAQAPRQEGQDSAQAGGEASPPARIHCLKTVDRLLLCSVTGAADAYRGRRSPLRG